MSSERFIYVTYIRTTAERLWQALTGPEFNRQYWFGMWQESEFRTGSSWALKFPDGRVADSGMVIESDPPRRLVLQWRNQFMPELHAEGDSRATFELEAMNGMIKLTVVHEIDRPQSKLLQAVSRGWPAVLSGLKSLLETGHALERPADLPSRAAEPAG